MRLVRRPDALYHHLRCGEVCIDPSVAATLVGTSDIRVLRDRIVALVNAGRIERWHTGAGDPVDLRTVDIDWLRGRCVGARYPRAV